MEEVLFSWQALLILIGAVLVSYRDSRVTGYVLMGVGAFFLLPEITQISFPVRRLFWPVLLIVIGLLILFGSKPWRHRHGGRTGSDSDIIDDVNVLGGSERILTSQNFKGGSIVSVFGGGTYDLRRSKLSQDENMLEMVNVFGGSTLVIPPDWDVKIDVVAIFGGFTDKRMVSETSHEKQLIIKGVAIFGGGEIKSA